MKNFKKLTLLLPLILFLGCGNSDNKKSDKELQLQEKELDLKAKELALMERELINDSLQRLRTSKSGRSGSNQQNHQQTNQHTNSQSNNSTQVNSKTTPSKSYSNVKTESLPDFAKKFVGTWTKDNNLFVEIEFHVNKFRIRQCIGMHAANGTEYWGTYKLGKIVATGNPNNFVKSQLPTFEILSSNKLLFESGAGPAHLSKTTSSMPQANYSPPINNN